MIVKYNFDLVQKIKNLKPGQVSQRFPLSSVINLITTREYEKNFYAPFVYRIRKKNSDQLYYVGSTTRPALRWRIHRQKYNKYKKGERPVNNYILWSTVDKIGLNNFDVEFQRYKYFDRSLIHRVNTRDNAYDAEMTQQADGICNTYGNKINKRNAYMANFLR